MRRSRSQLGLAAGRLSNSNEEPAPSARPCFPSLDTGWYLRTVHEWTATLMIAAVVLHRNRVYFTSAYRKPQEINWTVGMLLLICTPKFDFTGYSLQKVAAGERGHRRRLLSSCPTISVVGQRRAKHGTSDS